MLFSSQNKVFSGEPNYIKEMQINWESFVIVRDKQFNVEVRVFLMACLCELCLTCILDLVSKMFHFVITIISVNNEKDKLKLYFSEDPYLKMFT